MTRAALVNDGIPAFLAALVLVLVLMLIAVIRLPRWGDTHAEDDEQPDSGPLAHAGPAPDRDAPDSALPGLPARAGPPAPAPGRSRPAHARHGHTRSAPAGPRPLGQQPAGPRPLGQQPAGTSSLSAGGPARSQPGDADLPDRPGGEVPGRGAVRAPRVSGSPPWEPAPRPPG